MNLSLILNEYEWVEHHLETHSLGRSPFKTISKLAKYYYSQNYSKSDIKKMIEIFILQCEPSASPVKWGDAIDKVIKTADKNPLIHIDGVDIYQDEIDVINNLCSDAATGNHSREKRLAFTLLCVSKYWDKVIPENNHWTNTPDKEIMEMANIIHRSIKEQNMVLNKLKDKGVIGFPKKIDNLNIQVLFSHQPDNEGDVVMHITDFRNLGYQWEKYRGGNFYVCENCGLTAKGKKESSTGRPLKYCPECALDVKIKQSVDSVAKARKKVG